MSISAFRLWMRGRRAAAEAFRLRREAGMDAGMKKASKKKASKAKQNYFSLSLSVNS